MTTLKGGTFNDSTHLVQVNNSYYVMRRYGPETDFFIDRNIEAENNLRLNSLGLAPKYLMTDKEERRVFFEYIHGRAASEEDFKDLETLSRIIQAITCIHSSTVKLLNNLDPFRAVEEYSEKAMQVNPSKMKNPNVRKIHQEVKGIEKQIRRLNAPRTLCHNDLSLGNFVIPPLDEIEVRIIDWEFAAMGDPMFDLANFIVSLRSGSLDDAWENKVLDLYLKGRGREVVFLYKPVARYLGALWAMILEKRSRKKFDYAGYSSSQLEACVEQIESKERS